ncbi:uncharacterized protein MCYG_02940 [Microsporum canis CBS 113480]|uniref:Uncharacterized protein n=1 Tax=Arthroderma otae (strain ATCC MYA-4605 / CBS 113480) TaxID=554155 RepID=C5FK99_ARTOC|nr:uncharacterized protein MCYG_02940 [Microsporum canis CBS 113480]EEQ30121.1 predicted protein [Microsporum canis CBS 113480]
MVQETSQIPGPPPAGLGAIPPLGELEKRIVGQDPSYMYDRTVSASSMPIAKNEEEGGARGGEKVRKARRERKDSVVVGAIECDSLTCGRFIPTRRARPDPGSMGPSASVPGPTSWLTIARKLDSSPDTHTHTQMHGEIIFYDVAISWMDLIRSGSIEMRTSVAQCKDD